MKSDRLIFEHQVGTADRPEVETFVEAAFARCHGVARMAHYPLLSSLRSPSGGIVAAAGRRVAGETPLFLETYLDRPIESIVSDVAGTTVRRDRIVEIGSLAATGRAPLVALFVKVAQLLDSDGFDYAVVTATAKLRRAFALMGFASAPLAVADAARLPDAGAAWGRYYDSKPVVLAGRIADTRKRLDSFANGRFATVGAVA